MNDFQQKYDALKTEQPRIKNTASLYTDEHAHQKLFEQYSSAMNLALAAIERIRYLEEEINRIGEEILRISGVQEAKKRLAHELEEMTHRARKAEEAYWTQSQILVVALGMAQDRIREQAQTIAEYESARKENSQ